MNQQNPQEISQRVDISQAYQLPSQGQLSSPNQANYHEPIINQLVNLSQIDNEFNNKTLNLDMPGGLTTPASGVGNIEPNEAPFDVNRILDEGREVLEESQLSDISSIAQEQLSKAGSRLGGQDKGSAFDRSRPVSPGKSSFAGQGVKKFSGHGLSIHGSPTLPRNPNKLPGKQSLADIRDQRG